MTLGLAPLLVRMRVEPSFMISTAGSTSAGMSFNCV